MPSKSSSLIIQCLFGLGWAAILVLTPSAGSRAEDNNAELVTCKQVRTEAFTLIDANGKPRFELRSGKGEEVLLEFLSTKGSQVIVIGCDESGNGSISFQDQEKKVRVFVGTRDNGNKIVPSCLMLDSDGGILWQAPP